MEQIKKFEDLKDETGSAEQAKLALLADQLGVNIKKTTDVERRTMINFMSRSKHKKHFKKRK